jgi:hypothetical protein
MEHGGSRTGSPATPDRQDAGRARRRSWLLLIGVVVGMNPTTVAGDERYLAVGGVDPVPERCRRPADGDGGGVCHWGALVGADSTRPVGRAGRRRNKHVRQHVLPWPWRPRRPAGTVCARSRSAEGDAIATSDTTSTVYGGGTHHTAPRPSAGQRRGGARWREPRGDAETPLRYFTNVCSLTASDPTPARPLWWRSSFLYTRTRA